MISKLYFLHSHPLRQSTRVRGKTSINVHGFSKMLTQFYSISSISALNRKVPGSWVAGVRSSYEGSWWSVFKCDFSSWLVTQLHKYLPSLCFEFHILLMTTMKTSFLSSSLWDSTTVCEEQWNIFWGKKCCWLVNLLVKNLHFGV